MPAEARLHWLKGNQLFEADRITEAANEYDEALRIYPGYANARFNRALASRTLRHLESAIDDLLIVMLAEPQKPDAAYLVGDIIEERDGLVFAKPWYEKALANDPTYRSALEALERVERLQNTTSIKDDNNAKKSAPQEQEEKTESEEGQLKRVAVFRAKNKLSEIVGLKKAKQNLLENVILPIREPALYTKYGKNSSPMILLYGPPGCGKTALVRALAGEIEAEVIVARIHELVDMYTGNTEKNIHTLFEQARTTARKTSKPCIVFIDELDGIGVKRGEERDSSGSRRALDQLLVELDGIEKSQERIVVIGATNRPWDIDPALKRSGRFGDCIYIPPPSYEERTELFTFYSKRKPHEKIRAHTLAKMTKGFSSADIQRAVDRATIGPLLREYKSKVEDKLTSNDIANALKDRELGGGSLAEWWTMVAEEIARDPLDKMRYKPLVKDTRNFLRSKIKTVNKSQRKILTKKRTSQMFYA